MNLEGARVVVTGGAGFVGSHLVDELVSAGARVTVFDNFSSGHRENLDRVADSVEVVEGDVLDLDAMLAAATGADVICHQAAQLEIVKCIETPLEDLRANAEGTLNVLEAARRLDVPKVVYASSACVYGQAQYTPEDENHPTVPNWPYGVSKLAAEHYARIYNEYYGIETVGLRYSIVYGPREWYGRVLTSFLRRAVDGKPPVVFGPGEPERDFVYVGDVARLHTMSLERDGLGASIFNVSTGTGMSVRDLARLVQEMFGLEDPIHEQIEEGETSEMIDGRVRLPAELQKMILDPSRANEVLGWRAETSLRDGIQAEFDWLREHVDRWQVMHF